MTKNHAEKCPKKICERDDAKFCSRPQHDCACDGYHTFEELYDHRITLYIALCKQISRETGWGYVWRSKRHSDGELCFVTGTQFVMGIGKEKGKQVTYHIPIERWDEVDSQVQTLDRAPEYDGHTSDDVLERLKKI